MAELTAKVACRTPAKGRSGVTNIPCWKFDALRAAILSVLSAPTAFRDLTELVGERLSKDELARLGSLTWHVTTVKLELEVRGEIERSPGAGPQVLRRASAVG